MSEINTCEKQFVCFGGEGKSPGSALTIFSSNKILSIINLVNVLFCGAHRHVYVCVCVCVLKQNEKGCLPN